MAEKHLRKCSISLVVKEMQIKTTLKFHFTPVNMDKIKTQVTEDAGKNVEKGYSSTVDRVPSWYNYSGNQSWCSSENWT